METTLHEQNEQFAALGATHYHNAFYPLGRWDQATRLFSRHYFNAEGTEIGLVIPDMFSVGMGVQVFDDPRVWGIPHNLLSLNTGGHS